MFSNRAARLIAAFATFAVGFAFPCHLHGQLATQALISTAAGFPAPCDPSGAQSCGSFSGDGGPAIDAGLNVPFGVALDAAGNIYIADNGNCRIRRVDATTGIITTVAGGNGGNPNVITICNYNGDNIPATLATLSYSSDVAVDASGNIYIADSVNSRVRKVDAATGLIATVAGTGGVGYNGDNIAATSALLNEGDGRITVDAGGNLYIADFGNQRIRRVDATTGLITTIAGNGYIGPSRS